MHPMFFFAPSCELKPHHVLVLKFPGRKPRFNIGIHKCWIPPSCGLQPNHQWPFAEDLELVSAVKNNDVLQAEVPEVTVNLTIKTYLRQGLVILLLVGSVYAIPLTWTPIRPCFLDDLKPSLKLTAKAPDIWWLEDICLPFGAISAYFQGRNVSVIYHFQKATRWNKGNNSASPAFFRVGCAKTKQCHHQTHLNHPKLSKELLGQGQRPDVIDSSGSSALCGACKEGHEAGL